MKMFAAFVVGLLINCLLSSVSALQCACDSSVGGQEMSTEQLQQERYETAVTLANFSLAVYFPVFQCPDSGFCDTDTIVVPSYAQGNPTPHCWNYTGPFSLLNDNTDQTYWRDCAMFVAAPQAGLQDNNCTDLTPLGIPNALRCSCQSDLCNLSQGASSICVSLAALVTAMFALILWHY